MCNAIVGIDSLHQQSKILEHYVAQLKVVTDTAERNCLKALDMGSGAKGFDRAISGLKSYINAANTAIESGITE